MLELLAHQGRTIAYSRSLYESDGTTAVVLANDDVLQFRIGRGGAAPLIDLDSENPWSSGSSITIDDIGEEVSDPTESTPARYTIRLAQADLAELTPGTYDCELSLVDASDAAPPEDAVKVIQRGAIHIVRTIS